MSEETISLYELLNLSIGTPQRGAVNFGALHALLHAVLGQLNIRDTKTRWRDTRPGPDALVGVAAPVQEEEHRLQRDISAVEPGVRSGSELQERIASSPTPGPAASRIQTCEDDVSKVAGDEAETVTAVEKCCRRVDTLEETVRSLTDTFQKYPDPEELGECVTWDVMQSTLLSERENHQKELVNSGVADPATAVQPAHTAVNSNFPAVNAAPSHTSTPSGGPAAPSSPSISGQISTLQEVTDAGPVLSGPPQETPPATGRAAAGMPPSRKASGSERYPETVEALRTIGTLKERFNKLEARVAALEEGKVDQSQLTQLRELITNTGSRDASNNLMDQLKQQRALTDSLLSDHEKPDSLEDTFINLTGSETTSEAPGRADSHSKASHELRQQMSSVRESVTKLEEDVKQLTAKGALTEEGRADPLLQDLLEDLRGMLEDMMLSLTSELSSGLQDESDSQGLGQSKERSASASSTVTVGRTLSRLFQHYEQLQDTVNSLLQQQTGGRAGALKGLEKVELVNDVQKAILQLQAECEKLHETTRCLHEDNRQKQSHIEELYKTTEELEEKKADRHMVESEIQADKSALESKVSRLQFDSVTEQLNNMFHELLNKVTGQEQDWHKVMDKLSTEMECKLNRIELDSAKKQLEGRWRNIQEKLQAQGAPELEDAAGLRKQLVDRFHCLSCDRPVVKYTPGSYPLKLPSSPGFPSHRSMRPFTVYALEQFRQHYRSLKPGTNRYNFEVANPVRSREQLQKSHAAMCRQIESVQRRLKRCDRAGDDDTVSDSLIHPQPRMLHERISEMTDYSHLAVSRSCGGGHTVTSASQRRLQYVKQHHAQPEADGAIQSEEVDIVGLDGHIYRGRLNAPAFRNMETKLPTISTKDGVCKSKDKAKCSLSHKPATSPELGHGAPAHRPHSARSAQGSRSGEPWCVSPPHPPSSVCPASSSSGRDWPVSALGCTSPSSLAPAAAESNAEADEPLSL